MSSERASVELPVARSLLTSLVLNFINTLTYNLLGLPRLWPGILLARGYRCQDGAHIPSSSRLPRKSSCNCLDTRREVVSLWRKRFFIDRLAGLEEPDRPGRPPTFPPELVVQVKAPCRPPLTRRCQPHVLPQPPLEAYSSSNLLPAGSPKSLAYGDLLDPKRYAAYQHAKLRWLPREVYSQRCLWARVAEHPEGGASAVSIQGFRELA